MLLPRLCALSDEDPPVGTGSGGQVQKETVKNRKWWSGLRKWQSETGSGGQEQEVAIREKVAIVSNRKWQSGTGSGGQEEEVVVREKEVVVRTQEVELRNRKCPNKKWSSGTGSGGQDSGSAVRKMKWWSGCRKQESSWCAYRVSGNGPITVEEACDWSLCCWQVVSGWKTLGSSSSSAKRHDNCVPGSKPISEGLVKVPSCFRANHTWMDDGQTEAADWSRGSAGPTSLPVEDSLLPRRPTVQQQEVLPADAVQVSHDL